MLVWSFLINLWFAPAMVYPDPDTPWQTVVLLVFIVLATLKEIRAACGTNTARMWTSSVVC